MEVQLPLRKFSPDCKSEGIGVVYEFAQPGAMESEDAKRKRQQQNKRRVTDEERGLYKVVGDRHL